MTPLMDAKQLAAYLGQTTATVRAWRYREVGPPAVVIDSRVYYREPDVTGWLESLPAAE